MVNFIEDGHYYINSKGIIIPSVSDLVEYHFPGTYKDVPEDVLKRAAEYGTKVHEMLELYDNGEVDEKAVNFSKADPNIKSALKEYKELKSKYMIYPKAQEQIVDYKERYAGRYDKLDATNVLWDVKTTSRKYVSKWECQLGYYYLALGLEREIGYIIWLPKHEKGEVMLVHPWTNEMCLKGLENYEKHSAKR